MMTVKHRYSLLNRYEARQAEKFGLTVQLQNKEDGRFYAVAICTEDEIKAFIAHNNADKGNAQ